MVSALHDMNDDELQKKLEEFQGEMLLEEATRGMGYAMGRESDYARYKNIKRDIARVKTVMRENELKK